MKTKNRSFFSSNKEILKQCDIFYKNLYSSKINNDDNPLNNKIIFEDENLNMLSKEEQKECEGEITARECLEALKNMEHNKTPGSDESNSIKLSGVI